MSYPTPYVVEVLPYAAGEDDAHGNDADSWGAPVPHRVYGWVPAAATELAESGRDVLVTDQVLYAPETFTCQHRDRVTIGERTYEVQGGVLDYNHGFHQWHPGSTVLLRLVTG